MSTRHTLLAVIFALLLVHSTVATPIIDLGYAQYQGMVNVTTNVTTFLGIRYAAAPQGELRFRAPQPPGNQIGVQQATAQPNQCFQAGLGTSATNPFRTRAVEVPTSEDCLFLKSGDFPSFSTCIDPCISVYYPSDEQGAPIGPLPVIVWIHGGGCVRVVRGSGTALKVLVRYLQGSASQFRGTDILAQSNRGVVVVIIQYRLGVFGFLAGEEVKKNGALNAGLLDQDYALRWVNKHISKFGGDPSKVVIWGESAGAGSVLQHIVANEGQTKPQLFRGAITNSAYFGSQYNYNDRIPELIYREVVEQTNCSAASDSLACLRSVDVNALETANLNINADAFFGTCTLIPVVDGQFITQNPAQSLAQGKVNGEALLSVTNAFEGTTFVNQSTSLNATQYALDLFPNLGSAQAEEVGALYVDLGTSLFQTEAIMGEALLICPTYYLLQAFAGRAFKGEFAIPPAIHGLDAEYYFPSIMVDFPDLFNPNSTFNNTAFIDAFAQSFTSFAISLDPNIKVDPHTITPKWNPWNVGQTEMLFNKTEIGEPIVHPVKTSDALLRRCRFWHSVGNLTGQ
ncbi:Carboxylic ester hydrolase [Mycena venus]|uniref:Carboxylic ester hydrolase n=1 Tax=Mycena venus TaxID=2733690 RepID=A0A8H6XVL3_9AGAR|nr:Carboxylic ester hydrolase [Mycena venus]